MIVTPLEDATAKAAACLQDGGIVVFPTETVYGLGADATSPEAVARIFAAKERPSFNPLISHIGTFDQARAEAAFPPVAERLAAHFWPGPLTLVLPRSESGSVCDLACAGLQTVGLRMPANDIALDLLRAFGRPVAAPSANRSGRLSPTTAQHARADLPDTVDAILDGGSCPIGLESTIVACLDGQVAILREGGITREAIETVIGRRLDLKQGEGTILAPGMLASHYAPHAGIRLEARDVRADELGLDFANCLGAAALLDLSRSGNLEEAAANLYRHLRALDARACVRIAVAPVPEAGLGAAINDRLRRAAAPRPISRWSL